MLGDRSVGLVIVDGAHTYEQSLRDFEQYSSLMVEGMVVFHDSTNEVCDVARTIAELRSRGHSSGYAASSLSGDGSRSMKCTSR